MTIFYCFRKCFPSELIFTSTKRKLARIQVKNRIDVGDNLRLISPTQSVNFVLEKIYSLQGEEAESAHGGHVDVYISVPEKPDFYAVVRTKEDLGSEAKKSKKKRN